MLQARSWLPRTEGSVHLGFVRIAGGTALRDLRQAGAMRARFPRRPAGAPPEAVLLNTAGGLTGGDRIGVSVALSEGAEATVTTAAAEKIYRAREDETEIRVRLEIGPGARLVWLPQATIAFDQARLDRRTEANLATDASLLAVETLIFGRAAMGEDVHRGAWHDAWRVRRDGRLVFADAFRADGPIAAILDRGATLAGARTLALLLYVAPDAPARLEEARGLLDAAGASVTAGASAWNGLLAVRAVAGDGRTLHAALEPLIARLSGRPLPRVWQC
jgi:urease accessory protein